MTWQGSIPLRGGSGSRGTAGPSGWLRQASTCRINLHMHSSHSHPSSTHQPTASLTHTFKALLCRPSLPHTATHTFKALLCRPSLPHTVTHTSEALLCRPSTMTSGAMWEAVPWNMRSACASPGSSLNERPKSDTLAVKPGGPAGGSLWARSTLAAFRSAKERESVSNRVIGGPSFRGVHTCTGFHRLEYNEACTLPSCLSAPRWLNGGGPCLEPHPTLFAAPPRNPARRLCLCHCHPAVLCHCHPAAAERRQSSDGSGGGQGLRGGCRHRTIQAQAGPRNPRRRSRCHSCQRQYQCCCCRRERCRTTLGSQPREVSGVPYCSHIGIAKCWDASSIAGTSHCARDSIQYWSAGRII